MSVELASLDHDALEKIIGPECYETALEYVRRKAVSQQIWTASQNALFGIVDGRYGDHYTPTVYLSRQGPVPEVNAARCNCAASYGCEHAAALLITAVTGATTAGTATAGGQATRGTGAGHAGAGRAGEGHAGVGRAGAGRAGAGRAGAGRAGDDSTWEGSLAVPRQAMRRHAWDASLESWLAAGREAGRTGEATLAIELTLEADQAGRPLVSRLPGQEHGLPGSLPVRLMARLVQPGKQGGWVGGSLSWGKLGGYGYYSGPSAIQTRLLRELVALYRTRVSYLDGKTRDRAAVLREFKEGTDPVFLISLKAGGFGLNLAEADYCFLLDPWWNPATEAQAVDRTHRIGQTRNVIVYRLIARDTIEEKVMALKARKGELFASVVNEGNVFGGRLDEEDIRGLLA
ncbi:MAG TPA: C-terminal helicase domain-containing protein [Streptosporangiaceae bacterium]|nr:C-terminal helicase domain-containing protein [Streptosporangiaceae bacterium]